MGNPLTIRLDDELDRELARLAEQTGRTKSDVAREALRRQLSIQRFRAFRAAAMPDAAAAGYLTNEDIFPRRVVRIFLDTNVFASAVVK